MTLRLTEMAVCLTKSVTEIGMHGAIARPLDWQTSHDPKDDPNDAGDT